MFLKCLNIIKTSIIYLDYYRLFDCFDKKVLNQHGYFIHLKSCIVKQEKIPIVEGIEN